ncbi:peptidase S8 [Luteimonas yindakuii]|uniref:Peptidase S8 n=1 Tax=Luteimonas yindakuii TaxID=2565782 RepID=A0A4Z1R5B1_9GAMM|nr:peptidase S8 [Luteimonas yindakuii]TKS54640.1 peptidase S8 [Luteimonas yindakuii]
MSVSHQRIRMRVLVIATATALSTLAVPALAAERLDLGGLQSSALHDRFIVKYREGSDAQSGSAALQRQLQAAARAVPARQGVPLTVRALRRTGTGAEVVTTGRKLDRAEAEMLMRQIAADPAVEYVEVDQLLQIALSPNDPRYSQQWGYFNATGGIRADQAWDVATGAGVVVAVLDTGSTSHSDLNGNTIAGYDMISDATVGGDGNARDADPGDPGDYYGGDPSSWHGTHVAGTVAALTNNGVGVAGTAFNAKVSHVRVLGRGGGYTSDIADGIIWASGGSVPGVPANQNPAEVINLSLGGSGSCGSTTQNAINGAVSRGTTVVVAAGNSNANVSGFTPANCANVIAVAATDQNGARASFSNYGTGIDVSAPGVGIVSTLNSGSQGPGAESYASYNGTSMAAPHVAGVVALMQSAASTPLTPAQIEQILKDTARPLPGACSGGCGAGIINAKAAVDAAAGGGGGPGPDPDPPGGGALQNGVPVTGVAGAAGSSQYWTITVPAGATNLNIAMSGGSGDADLYVRFGSQPTTSAYDCRPYRSGNAETCTFAAPQAGTYHVLVRGYSAFSGITLTGSFNAGSGGGNQLQKGVPVTGLSGAASSSRTWTFNVPAGASNLSFAMSGGTGDADLYVRRGAAPTTSVYDCRPYRTGNNESCTFASPQSGTWHVTVRGYSAYSGVSLVGNYTGN